MSSLSPEIQKRLVGLQSSHIEPYPVQVQGEASYKENLEKICGYVDEDGYDDDSHQAALYLEDENPNDPGNAVRVEINDLTVGYLSRLNAKAYRQKLIALKAPENAIAICGASIKGGFYKKSTDEWADYGVRLDFEITTMAFTKLRFYDDEKPAQAKSIAEPVTQPKKPIVAMANKPKGTQAKAASWTAKILDLFK